jgi:UDP-N-acetylmuramoyl-L-alanyl-D-glutamate--2,6-diaminopimelate ligase
LKQLHEILTGVPVLKIEGNINISIASLELDSRKVGKESVFFAIKGTQVDAHNFIPNLGNNVAVVVCETLPRDTLESVCYVQVADSSKAMGQMAANFYGNPSQQMQVVAVTGTNGKTSIATLLYQLFTQMGYVCGLLSTVENKIGEKVYPSTHTTPHAIAIQGFLAEMLAAGCSFCFMEASSHAIHQNRMFGMHLAGAIFTNLTHDHLDYHNTFKDYLKAKKALFDILPKTAFALSNADDKNGMVMLQNTDAHKFYYGIKGKVDFSAKVLESDFSGMLMNIQGAEVHVKMIGGFNAYNILAVYSAAILLQQDNTQVLVALSMIQGAEGRFEYSISTNTKAVGIVDYAHTPDALKKVLETIYQLNSKAQQVITVVGCGGDRDKTKRPLMGAIAAKLSHKVVFTSDNPRSEDPQTILQEMYEGVSVVDRKKVLMIENRKQAIHTACMLAQDADIILLAGKGHENYQEIKGVKHPFDDKEVLLEAFNELNK